MNARDASAPTRQPRWVTPALLTVVVLLAAFTIGVLFWASGYGDGRPIDGEVLGAVVFALWNLLPFLAMGAVVVVAARRVSSAVVGVALGVVALAVLTVALLLGFITSESSTAAVLFVFLPIYQLLVVLATVIAALVIHRVRRPRPTLPR